MIILGSSSSIKSWISWRSCCWPFFQNESHWFPLFVRPIFLLNLELLLPRLFNEEKRRELLGSCANALFRVLHHYLVDMHKASCCVLTRTRWNIMIPCPCNCDSDHNFFAASVTRFICETYCLEISSWANFLHETKFYLNNQLHGLPKISS